MFGSLRWFERWLMLFQTKGMSLEDIAEVFGDNIVLEDANLEAIHARFKQSHYREEALADIIDNEKGITVVQDEGDNDTSNQRT